MSKPNTSSLEEILERRYGAALSNILSKSHFNKSRSAMQSRNPTQLKTQDTLEYQYHPVPSRTLRFKVKAANDAHVIFCEAANPSETDPVVEVFLGGWSNQKSAIRRDRTRPDKANVDTPDLLSNDELRGFWINYLGGVVAVGRENEIEPFLTWTDPAPINIGYFGVCTGHGSSGEWEIDGRTVYTHENLEYLYRPVPRYALDIQVRANHNAHIALTCAPRDTQPMIEIFLGGWENSASAIRYNKEKPDKVRIDTPGLLTPSDHKHFFISWDAGLVRVRTEERVIMEWQDPAPFNITHYGLRTSWGATGLWHVETVNQVDGLDAPDMPSAGGEVAWVPSQAGVVPPNAVMGGFDNENLYVGRAQHEGAVIPGKIVSSHGVCYIPWGGAEHGHPDYEVLTGSNLQWVPAQDGEVPPTAVIGGTTEDGETLYIGRAQHEGTNTVGKVQPSHKVCYISYAGQELGYPEYEILIQQ